MDLIDRGDIQYSMLYKEDWLKGTGVEAQAAWKSDIDKMPTVEAIPVEAIRQLYNSALEYRDRFKPFSEKWFVANDQAIGVRSVLDMYE